MKIADTETDENELSHQYGARVFGNRTMLLACILSEICMHYEYILSRAIKQYMAL